MRYRPWWHPSTAWPICNPQEAIRTWFSTRRSWRSRPKSRWSHGWSSVEAPCCYLGKGHTATVERGPRYSGLISSLDTGSLAWTGGLWGLVRVLTCRGGGTWRCEDFASTECHAECSRVRLGCDSATQRLANSFLPAIVVLAFFYGLRTSCDAGALLGRRLYGGGRCWLRPSQSSGSGTSWPCAAHDPRRRIQMAALAQGPPLGKSRSHCRAALPPPTGGHQKAPNGHRPLQSSRTVAAG